MILNVLLTIGLLALALGGKCGMSGLEFIIILQEGGYFIWGLACAGLIEAAQYRVLGDRD